jgi:L-asparaginase
MKQTSQIHFILTGGTVDSVCTDRKLKNQDSVLVKYLDHTIKPYFSVTSETPFMKDSREITDADRAVILQLVEKSTADKIIVIHGTYTLVETAEYLLKHFPPACPKRVVVTGAMKPLELPESDAAFNIGWACASIFSCPPGVWVAFNGEVWYPKGLVKNVTEERFELHDKKS